jgi:hypothetical protein
MDVKSAAVHWPYQARRPLFVSLEQICIAFSGINRGVFDNVVPLASIE